jgi:hypothetical protein
MPIFLNLVYKAKVYIYCEAFVPTPNHDCEISQQEPRDHI